jgi:GH15 family glucan-1,4-alpha-glucosidase
MKAVPVQTAPAVLREYALLADGERGILVGPHGEFAWMCFPRWHSDAIFCSLIGGESSYAVTPRERYVWGGYYEQGTLIWRSRWVTEGAVIECREALALPGRANRAVVLRRLSAIDGAAHVHIRLQAASAFDAHPMQRLRREGDVWVAQLGATRMRWSGAPAARRSRRRGVGLALELDLDLAEGERHDLVLELSLDELEDPPDPDEAWSATETGWRRRVPRLDHVAAQRDAQHAYAVMSGLSSASGGMVAAATTSLPERAREGRNYDYRYVWIRDQCYAGQALARTGAQPLLADAARFIRDRLLEDGAKMKPAYTIEGDDIPDERALDLPGYPGGSDRLGNRVNRQFQLDIFGEALLLFAAAAARDVIDADCWRAVEIAAEAIEQRWREPDAGVWELHDALWTHSRLACAAGLRAISRHAAGEEPSARWLGLADALTADASARAVHPDGRWQRTPDDSRVDAALLLAAIRGAVPADDPRSIATLRAVERELTEDGYCYRFRHDSRPLGDAEGAFLLCGYLMSLSYAQQGDLVTAARWFERSRAACGPAGLFSEEYDVAQRQLRGNLPQAFVHALMLECAAGFTAGATT